MQLNANRSSVRVKNGITAREPNKTFLKIRPLYDIFWNEQ